MTHNNFLSIFNYDNFRSISFEPSAPPFEEVGEEDRQDTAHVAIPSAPPCDSIAIASPSFLDDISLAEEKGSICLEHILLDNNASIFASQEKAQPLPDHIKKQFEALVKEVKSAKYPLKLCLEENKPTKAEKLTLSLIEAILQIPAAGYHNPDMPWISALDMADKMIAHLFESALPLEKKISVDIIMRHLFTKRALTLFSSEVIISSDKGLKAHPIAVSFIDSLYNFMTSGGRYRPLIDIKYSVLRPLIMSFAEDITLAPKEKGQAFSLPSVRQAFCKELENTLELQQAPEQRQIKGYLKEAFEDHFITEAKKCAIGHAIESNDIEAFAQNIKKLILLSPSSSESLATELMVQYFTSSSQNTLEIQLELSDKLLSSIFHQGLKYQIAEQALSAIETLNLPSYKKAAEKFYLPPSWHSDSEAIYKTFSKHVEVEALTPSEMISIREATRLCQALFHPLLAKVKEEAKRLCELEIKKNKGQLSFVNKCTIYQKVMQECLEKNITALGLEDREKASISLETFLSARLAKELLHQRDPMHYLSAIEAFESKGYLPDSLYTEACALQQVLTLSGRYGTPFHFAKEDVERIFPLKMIQERLSAINAVKKSEVSELMKAQRKTLRWALQILNGSVVAPPCAFDEALSLTALEIDSVLEEIKKLRGDKRNGLIHQAWVSYLSAIADKILRFDEIAPPGDKQRISNKEIQTIQKAVGDEARLLKTKDLLFKIINHKNFGTITIGSLSLNEFFDHTDMSQYLAAKENVIKCKAHFDRLKLRENELVGEGISASALYNEEGEIEGYVAKEDSILDQLCKRLKQERFSNPSTCE